MYDESFVMKFIQESTLFCLGVPPVGHKREWKVAHVVQQNLPVLLQVSPLEYLPSVLPSTARSATPSLAVANWLVDVPYKTTLSENRIPGQ